MNERSKVPEVRINGVPMSAREESVGRDGRHVPVTEADSEWKLIGETRVTPRGYQALVGSVRFDSAGMRVRVKLLQNGEFVRHLDITTEIARDLAVILSTAGELGTSIAIGTDDEDVGWWNRVPMEEFRFRVRELDDHQLHKLGKDIKASIHANQIACEGGNRAARAAIGHLIAKGTVLRQHVSSRGGLKLTPKSNLRTKEQRQSDDKSLLDAIGRELRKRYGVEASEEVFKAAKAASPRT